MKGRGLGASIHWLEPCSGWLQVPRLLKTAWHCSSGQAASSSAALPCKALCPRGESSDPQSSDFLSVNPSDYLEGFQETIHGLWIPSTVPMGKQGFQQSQILAVIFPPVVSMSKQTKPRKILMQIPIWEGASCFFLWKIVGRDLDSNLRLKQREKPCSVSMLVRMHDLET